MTEAEEAALIVFVHPDGELPNPWFRAYRRVRTALRRSAYDARVEQCSLADLPAVCDVLVIPPGLETAVASTNTRMAQVVGAAETIGTQLDELVERLAEDGLLRRATTAPRALAIHRGFMAITERARLTD